MKKLTIEEKAMAYDEALEKAKKELHTCGSTDCDAARQIFRFFPELAESEDEKIRKGLIKGLSAMRDIYHHQTFSDDAININEALAWLEKQESVGEIVERCKNSWYNEGKIDGMAEGLTEDEKYQQGWHDALEKQGEQKVSVVDFNAKDWYVSKVDGKIHDMTYNPTDKVEPKFNIGDVLCDKSCTTLDKNSQPNIEILDIRAGMYICNNCSFPISQQDEYELVAKRVEPQSAWSEEDDYNLQCMIAKVTSDIQKGNVGRNNELIDWLKSLKERVQPQPKQEWSS